MTTKQILEIEQIVQDAFERGDITEDDKSCIDMLKLLNHPKEKPKKNLKIFKKVLTGAGQT
jgi:hypothetical protein